MPSSLTRRSSDGSGNAEPSAPRASTLAAITDLLSGSLPRFDSRCGHTGGFGICLSLPEPGQEFITYAQHRIRRKRLGVLKEREKLQHSDTVSFCIAQMVRTQCQHSPTLMIDRVPQPSRGRFLAHITPHLIELRLQPAPRSKPLCAIEIYLHARGMEMLEHGQIHLLQVKCLFFNSLITVVGLTCNTRAVSRMPLPFMAISTICCFTC